MQGRCGASAEQHVPYTNYAPLSAALRELLYEYWVSTEVQKYLASHNKNTLVIFDDCNLFIPSLLHSKKETLAL